ncbi:hypothetical protein K474DRAFT_1774255 [Panus rudis PR-1116 ss-1]|nr:hypothetical protein K474DRAFT_1774255 [Panus rudis PR-1116 ss-1]
MDPLLVPDSESGEELEYLLGAYNGLRRTAYTSVALVCLIFYDYVLTFNEEINCIWKRKMNFPSLLCLLNRYLLLVTAFIIAAEQLTPWTPDEKTFKMYVPCRGLQITSFSLGEVLILLFEVFTVLRIYAILERSLLAAGLLAVVNLAWIIMGTVLTTTKYEYGAVDLPVLPYLGCSQVFSYAMPDSEAYVLKVDTIVDSGTILAEVLAIAFTMYKTLSLKREAARIGLEVSFTSLLLRDGTLQFGIILAISVLDIIMTLDPDNPVVFVTSISTVMQPILFSHFFFHLRQVHLSATPSLKTITMSAPPGHPHRQNSSSSVLQFAHSSSASSSIIGNLGAPLHNMLAEGFDEIQNDNEREEVQVLDNPLAAALVTPVASGSRVVETEIHTAQGESSRYIRVDSQDEEDFEVPDLSDPPTIRSSHGANNPPDSHRQDVETQSLLAV